MMFTFLNQAIGTPSFAKSFEGLSPKTIICMDKSCSREEVRELILDELKTRGYQAVCSSVAMKLEDLAFLILQEDSKRFLSKSARQEVLRVLFSHPRITQLLPELKRLKRRSGFYSRIDKALFLGRMSFAHALEREVQEERLKQVLGSTQVRTELLLLSDAFEAYLRGSKLWDSPLLFLDATQKLKESVTPLPFQEILVVLGESPEPRLLAFLEELKKHCTLTLLFPHENEMVNGNAHWSWERWHTLDDAAQALSESLTDPHTVILIPDHPSVRRSLERALKRENIPLQDARDPLQWKKDEALKQALLVLDLIATDFERKKILEWLRTKPQTEELSVWIKEIQARGIRQGIKSYAGGKLEKLYLELLDLKKQFEGKMTLQELRTKLGLFTEKLTPFLNGLEEDLKLILNEEDDKVSTALPLRLWLERLKPRLDEAPPEGASFRATRGLRFYRLNQYPLRPAEKVIFFGLPSHFTQGEEISDLWYSARDREILGDEFQIKSQHQIRKERTALLKLWISGAQEVRVLDARYEWDGTEREDLSLDLKTLGAPLEVVQAPLEQGAHPLFLPSFGKPTRLQPQDVKLPSLSDQNAHQISATSLDAYSVCPFLGLIRGRWKLYDLREPDWELWPEIRGLMLHEALRWMLLEKTSPSTALEAAWGKIRPSGIFDVPYAYMLSKKRMLKALESFLEKEKVYIDRAKPQILSLETDTLSLKENDLLIQGRPDRVDQVGEGIVIIDYKSSSAQSTKGQKMFAHAYRLQLPFYAVAAQKTYQKEVYGAQFVELTPQAIRSSGLFLKKHTELSNKEQSQKPFKTRTNSQSLLDEEPSVIWEKFEKMIFREAQNLANGIYDVKPKFPAEDCENCLGRDLCGERRKLTEENFIRGEG